ncbi:Isoleucine--tRNA ligase, cytoplasmic, partial [Xenoophorus captivus]
STDLVFRLCRFYTLLVLSTALFGKPPFKNVIVNGLVLAGDGQKMSKRKKNYPDPALIVQSYGADALRSILENENIHVPDMLKKLQVRAKIVLFAILASEC